MEKKRLYMEETIWKGNNKKKQLPGEGHYMGKVLHRKGTIRKRYWIEERLHR